MSLQVLGISDDEPRGLLGLAQKCHLSVLKTLYGRASWLRNISFLTGV